MRISWCLCLVLTGCSSNGVQCDRHLKAINPPLPPVAAAAAGARTRSAPKTPQSSAVDAVSRESSP